MIRAASELTSIVPAIVVVLCTAASSACSNQASLTDGGASDGRAIDAPSSGCGTGFELCESVCTLESPTACGDSCLSCPTVDHGSALCTNHTCATACSQGYVACATGCCATHIASIALGGIHACTLDTLGRVKCWGDDLNGETGDAITFHQSGLVHLTALPFLVPLPEPATRITTGGDHSCAVLQSGSMMCWGYNGDGALGNASAFNTATPVIVTGVASPTSISAGYEHTCAVVAGGVKCWGKNEYGQIGNGGAVSATFATAVSVVGITDAVAVVAGRTFSCALRAGGTVTSWGQAAQLGDPAITTNQTTPVAVPNLSGITALAAGGAHACALTSAGTIKCWGNNGYGQLGNGTTTGTTANPVVDVTMAGAASAITAGRYSTCAIATAGTMSCWGENTYGDIGDGTKLERNLPTANGLSGVVSISAGTYVSCAVAGNGTTSCSGLHGGILNQTTTDALSPIVMLGLP